MRRQVVRIIGLIVLLAHLGLPSARAAVGYVNASLPPGYTLLTNPLLNNDNSITAVFKGFQGDIPDGLTVYLLEDEGYRSTTYDSVTGLFQPSDVAAELLLPGRGFFVLNPTAENQVLTFVGTILEGELINPLRAGYSLVGSMVPREATPEDLSFPGEPGDVIYFFNPATQSYDRFSVFDDLDHRWSPALRPIKAGEAFLVRKQRPADWIQEFSLIDRTSPVLELAFLREQNQR